MKQLATLRVTEAAAKFGEHAPMATACCNACRTCVQTNLLGVLVGAVGAVAARFTRRPDLR
jgi:hypothetical protein